jgi:hypothetical protein
MLGVGELPTAAELRADSPSVERATLLEKAIALHLHLSKYTEQPLVTGRFNPSAAIGGHAETGEGLCVAAPGARGEGADAAPKRDEAAPWGEFRITDFLAK